MSAFAYSTERGFETVAPFDYVAEVVRGRTMDRAEYHGYRQTAHRLECESGLLRKRMPRMAEQDSERARHIRATIAAPRDTAEALRLRRWDTLRIALSFACEATKLRHQARRIAAGIRA
jgi:hypothetical protein